ncbi:unnamed protein product [Auanema sp. JU1783]|nr:unnamed protein product [Auanema sp. JU1783]
MSLSEPSDGLFGTCVELDVIERGIRRALGTSKRCGANKTIKRIGEDQGFFSRVGLLQCNWPSDVDKNLPNQIVIKLTTLLNTVAMHNRAGAKKSIEGMKRDRLTWTSKAQKLKKWHNNEILFYETIQALQAPPFLPRMYCSRKFEDESGDVGFICMEYADNCHVKHIYENLTVSEIEKTLESLAEVQAVMEGVSDERKRLFTVNAYEELYADILNPDVLSFRLDELRQIDSSLTPLIGRIEQEIDKLVSTRIAKREHIDLGMPAIFVQGDLYSTNLLWKNNENGDRDLHKIIDWQLCHYGCVAEDVARLFITCMSTEDRRMHWERLLEQYHNALNQFMRKEIFSIEQLKVSYCRFFCLAAMAFVATVPEVYRAATRSCSEQEKQEWKESISSKVKGILEDVLYFATRKKG